MPFLRHCIDCAQPYHLDEQEILDQTYSPLCTECLRRRCEGTAEERGRPHVPEEIIGELN